MRFDLEMDVRRVRVPRTAPRRSLDGLVLALERLEALALDRSAARERERENVNAQTA
jgi:hypothetical protein